MKLTAQWKEKLIFDARADGHSLRMDTKPPLGSDAGFTPKQLVVAGICGCTGMDVAALLKKYRQEVESFEIDADVSLSEGKYPVVFTEVRLLFRLTGKLDETKVIEAVKLSQTKFCSVSAMISKVAPIKYTVELNGTVIGTGEADFGAQG